MSVNEPVIEQTVPNNGNFVDQQQFNAEIRKYYSGHKENSKKLEWTTERLVNVIKLIDDYNLAKSQGKRPSNQEYHHSKKYDVMNVGNEKILIVKRKSHLDPIVQIIPSTEYYQRILDTHVATGHGRRDKIVHALRDKYVLPVFAINIFLQLCKTCLSKKSFPKSDIVVKPLISDDFNRRGLIHLVDFQSSPDKEYKWLLQYQDHLTKFCFLRPLRSKKAKEVAIEVLKIFLEIGCPDILQSDNGREFTASVLKEISSLWPACKIVNGRPRYPPSQESIERSNQDVKNMILAWMVDNNSTNWSIGCYFAQFHKNSSYHSTIARTPYKALFRDEPRLGLSSTILSKNIISKLETEGDVEKLFKEMNNNENIQNSKIVSNNITTTDEQDTEPIIGIKTDYLDETIISSNYETQNSEIKSYYSDLLQNTNESPIVTRELNIFICYICNKEASGAHTCLKCKNVVHAVCGVSNENEGSGSQLICNLNCMNEINIAQNGEELHINLKRTADDMTVNSSKKFKDLNISGTVLVEVPKVGRGPLVSKNVVGKILEKRNELDRVGTAFGITNDWIPRNAALSSPEVTLRNDIPEVTVPLRTIISSMSSTIGGQGMKQCNCKKITNGQCACNKCICKKARTLIINIILFCAVLFILTLWTRTYRQTRPIRKRLIILRATEFEYTYS